MRLSHHPVGPLLLAAILLANAPLSAAPLHLPEDAEIALGVEIGPLLDSPFGDKDLEMLLPRTARLISGLADSELDKAIQGVLQLVGKKGSPERDAFKRMFHRLTVAGPLIGDAPGLLWTVEGQFDPVGLKKLAEVWDRANAPLKATLEPKALEPGKTCQLRLRGHDFLFLGFADETHLYLSSERHRVEQALAHSTPMPEGLLKRWPEPNLARPVWLVGAFRNDDVLEGVAGSLVRTTDGLEAEMSLSAKSPEIATRLADQLREQKTRSEGIQLQRERWLARTGLELFKHAGLTSAPPSLVLKGQLSNEDLKALFGD